MKPTAKLKTKATREPTFPMKPTAKLKTKATRKQTFPMKPTVMLKANTTLKPTFPLMPTARLKPPARMKLMATAIELTFSTSYLLALISVEYVLPFPSASADGLGAPPFFGTLVPKSFQLVFLYHKIQFILQKHFPVVFFLIFNISPQVFEAIHSN